jgi:hypothetical protein
VTLKVFHETKKSKHSKEFRGFSRIKKKSRIPGVPRTLELSSSPEIKRFEAFQQFQDLLIYQSTKHSEPSFFMEFSRMSLMCVYFFFVCVPKIPLIFF